MTKNTRHYKCAVHKSIMRHKVYYSVTEQGAKALRAMFDDAKLRLEHRQEVTRGERHEK